MNRNSLMYWFPLIRDLGIPVPKTALTPVDRDQLMPVLEDGEDWPDGFEETVKSLARGIGYPLFLRSDLASAKHGWENTCYVESEEELLSHIFSVLEFNVIAGIVGGGLPYNALVFREFIPLDSRFTAWDGLPIARERRYFIKDGKVQCHHPYWIEDAVAKGLPKEENWKSLLAEMNREQDAEIALLTSYAKEVSGVLDGYWSVDFAKAKAGWWYLIDCALGNRSWHPECDLR